MPLELKVAGLSNAMGDVVSHEVPHWGDDPLLDASVVV